MSLARILDIPPALNLTTNYFVKLCIEDAFGKEISSNFYWLSAKPDVPDWEKGDAYYTPQKSYADFGDLKKLPPVKLGVLTSYKPEGEEGVIRIAIHNLGPQLAFFIHLQLVNRDSGEELLPVRWEDNYFSLLPAERRTLMARYALVNSRKAKPVVRLEGWNVAKTNR